MSFKSTLQRHQKMIESLFEMEPQLNDLLALISDCVLNDNKVLFFGNGGSASDAQHLAAEFVIRYKEDRRPLAAIALTTDTSILTAHSNDYSFETVFDRQIQALARPGDVAIGLSTSGNSANVINGINAAKKAGCATIAFTGHSGGQLKAYDGNVLVEQGFNYPPDIVHVAAGATGTYWISSGSGLSITGGKLVYD